ncbi:hypothetical protein RU639_004778 [Aspergillus parasiticus]
MSQYKYTLLTPRPETIRMLRLLPSEDNTAQIQCQLVDYTLPTPGTEDHPYEALSYVWGSENTPQSILIDGQTLSVTENLYTALLYLRKRQLERLLWIDAICINQRDEDEKAQQIQFMPMIYGQATQVIVWLGETADQSDKALETIRLTADDEPSEDKPTDIQQELNHTAIVRLLERPWFRRIWVLQEVYAAQDILVLCGGVKIHGYTFSSGLKDLSLSLKARPELQSLVGSVVYLMRGAIFRPSTTSSRGTLSLGELIDMYHARAATKKQDKVAHSEYCATTSAKPIQKGDIVCLLEGASKPSIIRPYKGYFSLIVTSATPLQEEEDVRWDEIFETLRSRHDPIRDLSLIWDWETSHTNSGKLQELEIPMELIDTAPGISGMDSEETKRFDDLTLIVKDTLVKMDMGFAATRLLNYLKESKLPISEKFDLAAAIKLDQEVTDLWDQIE